jgi:hypothetical protein
MTKKKDVIPENQWTIGLAVQAGMVLEEVTKDYFKQRKLLWPTDAGQAIFFLVSEVGEFCDAYVHGQANWVRNNPDRHEENDLIGKEAGDVLMLLVACEILGINPVAEMIVKMSEKMKEQQAKEKEKEEEEKTNAEPL